MHGLLFGGIDAPRRPPCDAVESSRRWANAPPDVRLIRLGASCTLVELPERLCQIKLEQSMMGWACTGGCSV
jgi:hypothetical protein